MKFPKILKWVAGAFLLLAPLLVAGRFWALSTEDDSTFAPPKSRVEIMARMFFGRPWKVSRAGRLKPGDPSPDFDLHPVKSQERVRLSDWRGKKPVALVFGSYT